MEAFTPGNKVNVGGVYGDDSGDDDDMKDLDFGPEELEHINKLK